MQARPGAHEQTGGPECVSPTRPTPPVLALTGLRMGRFKPRASLQGAGIPGVPEPPTRCLQPPR